VLTGYLGLSVGGTLSVGGIGGMSYRHGAQVDSVLALEVITGDGELKQCSPSRNRALFEAVLAGLGQCAIIVSATIRLVAASTTSRVFNLFYPDLPSMVGDLRQLSEDGRFDEMVGFVVPSPAGGWAFFIEAARHFTPPDTPVDADLLAGLGIIPGLTQPVDVPYFAYADRVSQLVAALTAAGRFGFPHPWLDLFVPGSEIEAFAGGVLERFTAEQLGVGADFPILLFPLRRDRFTRPLLSVPDEDFFVLFDILGSAPPDPAVVAEMVARNRALFEEARALGSTHYTISALPLSRRDWQRHFRPHWGALVSAKRRYDRDGVLTHGPEIF
jgi:FAD/FMN-containing dehydrogenase